MGAEQTGGLDSGTAEKEAGLRTFLSLPGGIPSHDTFGRVFARLDPAEFQRCFVAWVQAVLGETPCRCKRSAAWGGAAVAAPPGYGPMPTPAGLCPTGMGAPTTVLVFVSITVRVPMALLLLT
jgi:hypothetical protein